MNRETIPEKVLGKEEDNSLKQPPLPSLNKREFKRKGIFKDWQTILNLVLAVALIIVSVYAYNLRKEKIILEKELIQKQKIQDQVQNKGMEAEERIEEKIEEEGIEILEIKAAEAEERACQKITVKAQKGNGITHLARRGLKKYLEEYGGGEKLTKEHKIYIEDYLQNQTGSEYLKIRESRTFSCGLIDEAIAKSLELSPGQLENLKRYSQLVTDL